MTSIEEQIEFLKNQDKWGMLPRACFDLEGNNPWNDILSSLERLKSLDEWGHVEVKEGVITCVPKNQFKDSTLEKE